MKSKITLFVFLLFVMSFCRAQTPDVSVNGGEFVFNPEKKPCLTSEQRRDIIQTVKSSLEELQLQNNLYYSESRRGNHPLFIWPIQKASNVTFNDVWAISNYVDHNTNFPNQITDYNCGTKSYDTTSGYNHQGMDIYNWPFTWKLMDDDGVEIIAAAPGQIIYKSDGEFDRSCNFNTTTPWNAVYVQHSDGSVTMYGHMKNGSTTSKNVGDMVTEGEYLGIVGSSGVSTGPHLHFEVYEGVVNNILTGLIDPYFGSCNSMNVDSWWANQKPYVNPKINAVLTHSQPPNIFPPCPTTETTYISDDFETDDTIYPAFYLRDQTAGDNIFLEIIRPDNTTLFNNWNISVQTTASSWYYYWSLSGHFEMEGEWKWQVTFAGETVTHTFNVVNPLSVDENDFSQTSLYPNPFNTIININSKTKIKNATVVDILGKTVLHFNENSADGIKDLNLSQLSNGMYFVTLEGEENQKKTIKIIKR
ncbi:peptidoglycan DD-metalloendopeptidase family protein [Winogradskyella sp.]|uniref:peptidoglycan DD-metalloendopeptidase family protein n=1 Tax=Winogradskyella sp. TaxID=1883156 RepID=UPI0025F2EA91|nr:peptidoglycan DD-metalloendopeptidase family protein [Winogradskyella sp.]